ncbi:lipopolysaccharide biosynthesis protein [Pseudomonas sp. S3E12]|uniref:lipopolysaccharide biosynthesis protein n=1 Tax=Pseudomonas sp. S3E12 TaxID=1873126 RepID=UPI00081BFD6F|nr:oligosaccharide flippase family protein [Pseudomonas sp. S3E12]OCW24932.1 hypothetical protein BB029_11740 [Pseudomonas sp. S3E12]
MSLIRRNMLSNFAGQGWIALMGFVFVPFYLKFIGAEGYGLVGFFVVLSSSLAVLDAGLSATAIREITTYNDASQVEKKRIISLLMTIEILFWGMAFLVGGAVIMAAPLIAEYWLKINDEHLVAAVNALRLMGAAIAAQFPLAFYNGCLIGLQRQLTVNVVGVLSASLKGAGAVLVLWMIAPTVEAFFAWQCIIGMATALALRFSLRHEFNIKGIAKRFNFAAVAKVRKFALGVGGVNILAFILTQVDKIILSTILPINMFGYYMLAWTLGTLCFRVVGPVFNAYYPRFTQLVELNDEDELKSTYLKACCIVGGLVAPLSIWIAFYAQDLLVLWTHNEELAQSASGALALISIGAMFNSFVSMPYALQLSNNWTALAFWQNLFAIIFILPATYFFAKFYGLSGAALPWMLLNLGYVLVLVPIMYRRLVRSVMPSWYGRAVLLPTSISLTVMMILHYSFRWEKGILFSAISMVICLMAMMGTCFYFVILRFKSR